MNKESQAINQAIAVGREIEQITGHDLNISHVQRRAEDWFIVVTDRAGKTWEFKNLSDFDLWAKAEWGNKEDAR